MFYQILVNKIVWHYTVSYCLSNYIQQQQLSTAEEVSTICSHQVLVFYNKFREQTLEYHLRKQISRI